jgi:RNA polymerase sigma-70 factor, ECF subfamily
MEIGETSGSVAISLPKSRWRGSAKPSGVRGRSFVPSGVRTIERMTQHEQVQFPVATLREFDDERLIHLFQAGNRDVFRVLVERHQERIRNLLYSIFHDRDFINDLSQEVFIKAYNALPNFRFESSFYTWLYRIAVNRSRDELRRKKTKKFFSFQTLDDGADREIELKLSVAPENRDDHEIVSLGLQTLPEKFRTAVILKDIDGLPYEEIAEIMDCELGTVKSRISRGRTMLRKAIEPLLKEVHT